MGEWIGNRAQEAVRALNNHRMDLESEVTQAHLLLDTYGVPKDFINGEQGRPFTLTERIDLQYEQSRAEIITLVEQVMQMNSDLERKTE